MGLGCANPASTSKLEKNISLSFRENNQSCTKEDSFEPESKKSLLDVFYIFFNCLHVTLSFCFCFQAAFSVQCLDFLAFSLQNSLEVYLKQFKNVPRQVGKLLAVAAFKIVQKCCFCGPHKVSVFPVSRPILPSSLSPGLQNITDIHLHL